MSTPSKEQLLEKQRRHLIMLLHAAECQTNEYQSCPLSTHCQETKRLWRHMDECTDGHKCSYKFCRVSRKLLSHYTKCMDRSCRLCPSSKFSQPQYSSHRHHYQQQQQQQQRRKQHSRSHSHSSYGTSGEDAKHVPRRAMSFVEEVQDDQTNSSPKSVGDVNIESLSIHEDENQNQEEHSNPPSLPI